MKLTDYRLFGRTGVKVSPLTLGCMMFGGKTGLDDSIRIIDRAIARPTAPAPRIPTVLPSMPCPYRIGRQPPNWPLRTSRSPESILRPSAIINPIVNSAVGAVKRSGMIVSHTFRRVQASTSKLSYPLRAQATIRRFGHSARNESSIRSDINAISPKASRQRRKSSFLARASRVSFDTTSQDVSSR
jgi:hypothetical protein